MSEKNQVPIPPFFYFPKNMFYLKPMTFKNLQKRNLLEKIPKIIKLKASYHINQGNRAKNLLKILEKHGEVVSFFVGKELFITAFSPESAYQISVAQKNNFSKGRAWNRIRKFGGEGMLTLEEPTHTERRNIAQPSLNYKKIQNDYFNIMCLKSENKMSEWKNNKSIEIHEEMVNLTLEIVCQSLFGIDFKEKTSFVKKHMDICVANAERTVSPLLHRFDHTNLPIFKQFRESSIELFNFVKETINKRIENPIESDDLLNVFIKSYQDPESNLSLSDINNEILTILLAGFETTANSLSFAICNINDNPEYLKLMKKEAREILSKRNDDNFIELVSNSEICSSVIKETLRMFPPLWVQPRFCKKDSIIDGHFFPQGASIVLSSYPIHNNPKIYKNPEKFMPERWTKDFESNLPRGSYFPFGMGSRKCIGDMFAMLEMKIILLNIFANFDVKTKKKNPGGHSHVSYRPSKKIKASINPIDL
jgi:cytochrome P450